ncbi:hypothetical protein CRG98_028922 [Punica granatum]|uniref:Serine carboxypeptidase-like 18 n=1 Tax=Punica granatum TaxID=22663 RepID=A0A2I0J376_PUNGR|nr:hypothetical protein CRG98_028922 [Punica granatum]
MESTHRNSSHPKAMPGFCLLLVVLFSSLTIPEIASSATIVKTLPGYDGELPFSMETGYIGVGETDSVQLFYYFVKSQRSPSLDPLILWLAGGPGCSALLAFFYESGPLSFIYDGYNGSLPSLRLNPYTWTKWLLEHPEYISNQMYVNGDSYSGVIVPLVIQHILDEPTEATVNWERRRSLREKTQDLLLSHNKDQAYWCRSYQQVLAGIWANDKTVQAALNVREGAKDFWKLCNMSLSYTEEISSVIEYHRNFSLKSELRALIYSGDHDMSVPHIATREWIQTLNLTLGDSWRAWYHNGQVAGYTEEYKLNDYVLDFVTVKNGGHIAALYKQEECSAMGDRWFAHYPL